MKNLKIEYNNVILFDGEVDEVVWSDGPVGVAISGKHKKVARPGGGANGLLDMLTSASKKKTDAMVEAGRSSDFVVEPEVV